MKPVNTRLDPRLLARARKLERLTELIQTDLPAECRDHCHVARIQDDTVHIVTDSPVWSTRLRQLGPRIIRVLHDHGHSHCRHVRITTRMGPVARKPAPAPVQHPLSAESSEHLRQTSSYIDDPALSRALKRLARHGGNEPPDNQ